ncbi:CDC48 [Symbiodinium pilosum]|uniref:CDC48 protein n=1 Tax=Symbiodinium pilosum TaxID=2952 RepID=A0A812Y9R2_SYMPI|nr:CDC48 [Symbiodinium pilosum]
MYVATSLLGAGYLREEFRHSPYATNAYLVATPSADRVLEGKAQVSPEAEELSCPPDLLFSAVDASAACSAAKVAAALRAGSDRASAAVRQSLRRLRVSLGKDAGVPGQFVLTDDARQESFAMPCHAMPCLFSLAIWP